MKLTTIVSALALTLAAGTSALTSANVNAQESRSYILATASTGGTYYPVGVALATLTKVRLEPKAKIGMSAINSAGSGENVRLLREGEAQFAILQGLFGYYAKTGTGPVSNDGPQEHLRSMSMLWQNVEHFVVANDAVKTGTIEDVVALKGEAMALGARNSGTIGSNETILAEFGIDINNDFELIYGGYGPSAAALQDGKAKGIGAPGGVPVGAITQLMASIEGSVTLLGFTDEQVVKADGGKGLWTAYTIAADTYPGQDKPVQTIAQPNFLATHVDIPEEDVYLITKTIYENLPFLQAIHPATKAMAVEKALAGLPIPLHPGAAKYYQEIGLTIPDALMPR